MKLLVNNQKHIGTAKRQKDIKHRRMNKRLLELQTEHDVLKAMNRVEELKKEKENELNSQARDANGTD